MAYDPNELDTTAEATTPGLADANMAAANEAQRQRFAANPVSSGTPAAASGSGSLRFPVPSASGILGAAGLETGGPYGVRVRPTQVAPSATQPRRELVSDADNAREANSLAAGVAKFSNPGVITQAAAKAQPGAITGPRGDYSGTGPAPAGQPPMTTEQANEYYGAQNRVLDASQNQQRQAGQAAQEARIHADATRPDSRDIARLESEDRVAKFRATDGADMVLASGNNEYEGQRLGILKAAERANANLGVAKAAAAAPIPGQVPANLVQAAQEANEAGNKNLLTKNTVEQGKANTQETLQKVQIGAEGVKHQKQLTDMGNALGAAKSEDERATISRNILTLLGKDPKRFEAIHAAGESGTDPGTGLPFKHADQVILIDHDTGKQTVIGLGAQQAAKPPADWMAAAKKANPNMSDEQLAAAYKPR